MWKNFSKVWALVEHIHTTWWVIGIIGGAGMIANIIQYIVTYPIARHFWVVFFISLLFLSVPFFISRYTRNSKNKINIQDFSFVEDPGFYIDKKTQTKYCSKCFSQNKLNPLSFHVEKGLICRQCEESYVAPLMTMKVRGNKQQLKTIKWI